MYRLQLGYNLNDAGVVNGCRRMNFFIYDGDGISKCNEIMIVFPGKSWVYICWLIVISDSSYSSNTGISLLVISGVSGLSSGIVRWGKSWVIAIDKGSRKTNALQKGHRVLLAEMG